MVEFDMVKNNLQVFPCDWTVSCQGGHGFKCSEDPPMAHDDSGGVDDGRVTGSPRNN